LRKRYLVTDQNKYHLRDRNNEIAFEDKGNTLTTKLNDPDIIASMIDLAQSKGWQTLKIDGSKEFKAEAWLQAAARGIDVKGHEPSPLDLAKLTDLKLEETRAKAVTDRPKTASQTHAKDDDPPKSKEERYALETIKTIMQSRGDTDEAIAMAQKVVSDRLTNNRVYVGEIKDIGTAPFDNDPKEKKTPFVTLATHDGDKQIWGVDLPRAIEEGKVKIGDRVTLTNEGKQPVQVNVDKYDDKGAKTTVVETVNRNTWKIQNLETIL
jgi:hypothetical protein